MGNSQSNSIEEEYSNYIKQQQRIIDSQQAQINQLYQNQQVQTQQREQNELNRQPPKKSKFDMILDVFGLDRNYDEISLKKAYVKLALEHHPDKGGNPESFKKLQVAYKLLLKKLSEKDSDKDHQSLKDENREYLEQQRSDNRMNTNLSEKFDKSINASSIE